MMNHIALKSANDDGAPIQVFLRTRVKPASIWELGLVSLWMFVTFITFPGDELILYPSALIFLVLFIQYREFTIPLAMKAIVLVGVPVLGLLSFGWAASSSDAIRVGAMMTLNFLIMVTIASRLTRQELVRALLFAGILAIIMAAPKIDTFAMGGPYGSKQIFAIRMLVVAMAGTALAYDSGERVWLRILSACVAAVAYYFVYIAESATALVMALGGFVALTGAWLIWQPAARIPMLRVVVILFILGVAALGLLALLSVQQSVLFEKFLNALGKDTTLTNRTLIWEAGHLAAKEKPWLGHGLESFWRPDSGAAQTINELDHRAPGTRHSFHNVYIEVQVALGFVGLILMICALAWSYMNNVVSWLRSQGMASSFFLAVGSVILITSFTESYLLNAFDTLVLLFHLGGLTAIAEPYHRGIRQPVSLIPNS
ncbi:MAG: hypothetical protein B7X55_09100 [Rhodobacterales bacterium 34-62-10]|nr:MAG: hypothetical protein B7X55_09100 [Rhodobacterales bacterium 34-62-10]